MNIRAAAALTAQAVAPEQPPQAPLLHQKYRPDIDGLRAVAVLAVVAFHAFPGAVRSGFIGVDIFFVISGFLISTIIIDGLEAGTFSFFTFYTRRIRRIFPALQVVLIACLVAGWVVLLAGEYQQLGSHIAAGAGFVLNFVLWRESGYFDNLAETKPLLHLWSLAVEEQFYILWPLLLWGAAKRRWNLFAFISIVALVSFVLNIIRVRHQTVEAFFSPHTRFWEILVGALTACAVMKPRMLPDGWWRPFLTRNARAFAGAALIAAGLVVIRAGQSFPGWRALLPTVGTALLIAAGPQAWLNRTVLAARPLVWVGLVSFPLYLWHWPLLSFARISESGPLSLATTLATVLASAVLAVLTYVAVERPLRFGRFQTRKVAGLSTAMVLIATAGLACYASGGAPERAWAKQGAEISGFDFFKGQTMEEYWKNSCFLSRTFGMDEDPLDVFAKNGCESPQYPGHKTVYLIGDSHSAFLSLGLREYLTQNKHYNLFQFSYISCSPLSMKEERDRCRRINEHIFRSVSQNRPDLVVIFNRYASPSKNTYTSETTPYYDVVRRGVETLGALGAKRILLIGQAPTWTVDLRKILIRRFLRRGKEIPTRSFEGIDPHSLEWDALLRNQRYPDNVTYVSLKDFLCNADGCLVAVGPDLSRDLIVVDGDHLSKSGAVAITRDLLSSVIEESLR